MVIDETEPSVIECETPSERVMLLLLIAFCIFSLFLITGAPSVVPSNHRFESLNSNHTSTYDNLFEDITTRASVGNLGSCTIPNVTKGSLGYYEKVNQYQAYYRFIQFQVGKIFEHSQGAVLLCNEGFAPQGSLKPLGGRSASEPVTCENGTWSRPLICRPVSCLGEPPRVENGYPVIVHRTHGNAISYFCNKYYVITKRGSVECHYGTWRGRPPVCVDGRCYTRELNYTGIAKTQVEFVSHLGYAKVVCTKGYKPFQSGTIIPCSMGKWNIPQKLCVEDKTALNAIAESTVSVQTASTVESTTLQGIFSGSVTKDKELNPPPTVAGSSSIPLDNCVCSYYHDDINLQAEINGLILRNYILIKRGDTALLSCANSSMNLVWSNGACPSKTAKLMCNVCQRWKKDNIPTCQISETGMDLSCTKFPDEVMTMLKVDYEDTYIRAGSRAVFSCRNNDLSLNGTSVSVCLRSGEWSSPPPQCTKPEIRCPPLDENGAYFFVYSNDRRISSTVTFYCKDANHLIEGFRSRTCLSTGEWSDANPVCKERLCEVPLAPEHGFVHITDGLKVGSRAQYTCDKNAILVGNSDSKCLINGEWSFSPPKCLRSCAVPEVLGGWVGHYEIPRYRWPNRYQRFSEFQVGKIIKHGETIILHCKEGFTLVENSTSSVHRFMKEVGCENGKWSNSLQCKSGRCSKPPPPIDHGKPEAYSQEHNSKLEFKCDEGFQLKGLSTIRCEYGEWKGQAPECVKVTACNPPENPKNGKAIYSSLHFGSKLTIECDDGYHLRHMEPVYCKPDGTWNMTDMKCVAVLCDPPKNPINGKVSYTSLKFGSELMFECDDAYLLQQVKPVRCLSDGTWSKPDAICVAVNCEHPNDPENGDVFYTSLKVGSLLNFECHEGFRLQQSKPVYCTSNGTWSTAEVICSAIYCELPKKPENGDVSYTSLRFGSKLDFKCDEGYRLHQSNPVHCTSNGTWSTAEVICNAIYCKVPENPENGDVFYTSLKFRSELNFECNEGYRLQQSKPVYCTSNGTWSTAEVLCKAYSCDVPKDPENGKVIYTSLKLGSQLTYYCDNGYRLRDTGPVYCTSERVWSNSDVACVAKTCNRPKDPDNGHVIFSSLKFKSELTFICDDGYLLKSKGPVYCTSDGTWSSTDVQCVAKTCNYPEHLENGHVIVTSLTFGSQLNFGCKNGYRLQASEPVYCTSNGTWSKSDVRCVAILCDKPEHPENGQVIFSSLRFLSELKFKCDNGYLLNVEEPIYCTSDGIWSRKDVKCIAISCNPPKHPDNGKVFYSSLKFGSQLEFKCNDGYKLQNAEPVYCTSDGTWNRTNVECIAISCGLPDRPDNGQVTYDSLKLGSQLQFKCDVGYQLQDMRPVYCTADGTWTRTNVQCEAISCDRPEHPDNGQVSYSSLKFGSQLQFKCDVGYQLQDTRPVYCTADGSWSRTNIKCEAVACDIPKHPENGEVLYTSLEIGSVLKYKCDDGYQLQAKKQVYCTSDRTWSKPDAKCVAILCDPPEHPENGQVTFKSLEFGSQLKFRCEDGYQLEDTRPVYCTSDGSWSRNDVRCIAVACDIPKHPENGEVLYTSLELGSVLKYKCDDGYQLQAKKQVYCTSDRTWSKPDAKCVAILCDPPEHPENGQVTFKSLEFGSQLKFRCEDGYHLEDTRPVYCTSDGSWSRNDVRCIAKSCGPPKNPENGRAIVTSLEFGSQLEFKCDRGYKLLDTEPVYCKPDGTWSKTDVRCGKPCILQSLFLNLPEEMVAETEVNEDEGLILMPHNSTVRLTCSNNVNMMGNKFAKCGINGDWEYDEYLCITRCPLPEIPQGSELVVIRPKHSEGLHIEIREMHIHPDYDPGLFDADIALIQLDSPVQLNTRVKPVCLPTEQTTRENLVEGNKGVLTGWGMDENETYSETLQQAVLPVVSQANCEKGYGDSELPLTVTENMFCASYAEGESDACSGDTGGPMVFTDSTSKERRWVLEGVVSWGSPRGCGNPNQYGGFTTVSRFLDWINLYL